MTELLLKYFREKQQRVSSEKTYDTQCPYCSMQCKIQLIEQSIVSRKKYTAVGIDNPTTQGRFCIKGMNAHQHALHRDRITHPMLKKNGNFERITWNEALEVIRENFEKIQEQYGHDAISVYGGGSLTNEEAYLLGKFARVALKTKYIDYNGRFCMAAAATAANQVFGIDRGLTNSLSEITQARCIILAGTNIAECQPTIMPYFEQAKENGAYIIVIDPRDTATCELADLHLKIKPGKDAVLTNGLLKVIFDKELVDREFVSERTTGFEELESLMETIDLEEISSLSGIPLQQIEKAASKFAESQTGMIFTARGLEQQTDGYMAVRNLLNVLLVTGKIGKPGSGYGAITGQGNGQGGREHGQKADQLPGYRLIENPEHRDYISEVWGIDEADLPRKGVSAYEMMEKINDGEIQAMFLMGSNPIVSNPNASLVKKALEKLPFLVAVDMFISETAELADLVLPTSSYMEDEGTMTNLEGRVILRPGSKSCPGEVKHDWEILCEVANVLGKGEYFSFTSAEAIFEELRVASKGGAADYYGITYERIKEHEGLLWPCPSLTHKGTHRLFEKEFHHPDKKARFIAVPNEPELKKEVVSEQFPLYLTTGRVMAHYLTGVQTRKSSALAARNIEAYIEIHPATAEKYRISAHSLVEVESPRGKITVRSKLSDAIRQDTVFVPFHWSDDQNVNNLISEQLDPTCRIPGFKICPVTVRPKDE
ncbi:assimilatory nitrate reductase catalytic subunit NasC [Bacillus alkalicellulosilyticus]|uniref:assimilatory nitrate reductase catalytic subunit NasC n=1 Tax=Alkalihalobacterium alkalicellulosilyticum TaxID=1912214 RepID=UPI0009962CE6|nr:nitrate reductase [Bacillus alkalicellulosilyticus]